MELLRFATAGSVDDGKSTLIGRLLHDTKALFDDVIDAVAGGTVVATDAVVVEVTPTAVVVAVASSTAPAVAAAALDRRAVLVAHG